MLKESIKSPIFTDGFRLIDLLCQSYPPHCVVLRLELSEWLWKKSHREQPIVRLAMCERSSLGLPHTQNRMSGRPRVAEILLMRSPKTLRVRGDLKTRPKFVGSDSSFFGSWSSVVVRRGRCRAEDEEEGRAGGRGVQLRYARGSRASRVCARTSTHPRTGIPAGPVRTLAGLQGRCARLLPGKSPSSL